jgi:redox-sensitive bicupin YhaK (pirin superfamily)
MTKMSIKFSPIAEAKKAELSAQFSAHRLDLGALTGFSAPIMGFDHFRASGPTFAPHPHAGFSAVSYLFEDSTGGLRNRDSLGHDLVIEPGAMVWTQAAHGVVHDEHPAVNGEEVHGLQLFVNLSRSHKNLPPRMIHASADQVPTVVTGQGARVRILTGCFNEIEGPIAPVEPFTFLDVTLSASFTYSVPNGQNVLIYVLSGALTLSALSEQRSLTAHQAIAARSLSRPEDVHLVPDQDAHVLILSGFDPQEPVAVYGPFIMNDQAGLQAAYSRYVEGKMGKLPPL